ncbi:PhoX family protein [Phreatobacter cathodiphilus]|uniref:dTDP-glucose 4,6-dehydratase n=1 Tax=Phreatobacter cathodiphilus TaxID=1868589 RepID=A0A2S0NAT0_9HYPH|nr:PhoX family phosphatase [Phreatobacter cathodiphilus]AVO45252.1 dTDP-glucose 4,6-dehydratase [Phreatobacter cathodiphilus]
MSDAPRPHEAGLLSVSQRAELAEDRGTSPADGPTFGDVVAARFHRRELVKGVLGVGAITAALGPAALAARTAAAQPGSATPSFGFRELSSTPTDRAEVASGHAAEVLIRWGDPVLADAPAFAPTAQTGPAQARQFGYNNDYLGYFPLPGAANPSRHGLLCVNHEYTNEELMFPGLGRQDAGGPLGRAKAFSGMTAGIVAVEMMAHGGSVLEVRREGDRWRVVQGSRYARRITAETPMAITGPAAGDPRMRTSADPQGRRVLGMLNNCAGGRTPWGTWLTCEENVNGYFTGRLPEGHRETANYRRMGIPGRWYNWGDHVDRFNVEKEPNEANRFGWVVEIDPFDPASTPKKRTALGRFKHEGAAGIVSRDGRYVLYSGDDERFDYVYRFVTAGRVSGDRARDADLLDSGTLFVARYNADGSGDWLPLVVGEGPLTSANGFHSQADVLIETRRAADLLGATRMDRPEDVEANPATDKVYVMLTNNSRRKAEEVDAANPRADNRFGHIVEMLPDGRDHAAPRFTWDILVRCGDPAVATVGATFNSRTSQDGWFGMPDNCAVDADGRLWVATDGNTPGRTGRNDGVWAMETEGEARGTSKLFFKCPFGAELCGPEFTPDGETFFVAIQHPGEADPEDASAAPATYENPSTRWPDFSPDMPPRPSIVAITRQGGGKVGS